MPAPRPSGGVPEPSPRRAGPPGSARRGAEGGCGGRGAPGPAGGCGGRSAAASGRAAGGGAGTGAGESVARLLSAGFLSVCVGNSCHSSRGRGRERERSTNMSPGLFAGRPMIGMLRSCAPPTATESRKIKRVTLPN